jgi:hypothetical protein
MKFRLQTLFAVAILIFFIVFVYQANEWRLQARLYPWVIGMPMLVLALLQIFFDLTGKTARKNTGNAPVDFQFGQSMDSAVATRRTWNILSWIFSFFVVIWLLGFGVAVPAFVFFYLKFQAGEKWWLSVVLTAGAWVFFWGLFTWLLNLPFPEGELLTWIGLT